MKSLAALAAVLIAAPSLAFAHAGGLDSSGCHQNNEKNVYECHKGPLAGQTFKSKADAEKAMKGAQTGSAGKSKDQSAAAPDKKKGAQSESGKSTDQSAAAPDKKKGAQTESGKSTDQSATAPEKKTRSSQMPSTPSQP